MVERDFCEARENYSQWKSCVNGFCEQVLEVETGKISVAKKVITADGANGAATRPEKENCRRVKQSILGVRKCARTGLSWGLPLEPTSRREVVVDRLLSFQPVEAIA